VRIGFRFVQPKLRPADNDRDLVFHPIRDELVDRERARDAVHDREHVCPEIVLKLSLAIQIVQDNFRDRVTLEHDYETLSDLESSGVDWLQEEPEAGSSAARNDRLTPSPQRPPAPPEYDEQVVTAVQGLQRSDDPAEPDVWWLKLDGVPERLAVSRRQLPMVRDALAGRR
jgi:hypothetical protein